MRRLSSYLRILLKKFEEIYLPLPNSLCRDIVEGSLSKDVYDPSISLRYLNSSLERLWRPVLEEMHSLSRTTGLWDKDIICYYKDDYLRDLEDAGVEISRLLILANVYGRIDLDSWIKIFERRNRSVVEDLLERVSREKISIIVDNYVDYVLISDARKGINLEKCVFNEVIPAPQDLLIIYLMRSGGREEKILLEIISWVIRFYNKIILTENFDEVYNSFIMDKDYIRFLESMRLNPINNKCVD